MKVECVNSKELLFKIIDRYKMTVAFLNKDELLQYLDGSSFIRDSKGKQWNVLNSISMFIGKNFIINELKNQGIDLN